MTSWRILLVAGLFASAWAIGMKYTHGAMSNLSYVGNLLIFCVGWNLIHTDKHIRVANMLPSLVVAVIWSFVEGALNG